MRPDPTRCEVAAALDAIVGKWKTQILLHLFFEGTMRFGELRTAVPGITPQSAHRESARARSPRHRRAALYPEVPPKVEYSLTEYGRTLGLFGELQKWARGTEGACANGRAAQRRVAAGT